MENKYTAFISYRHLPLDGEVAQRLHKLLERYHVPKDLRKNGKKELGRVFRDRDELPLTSDLTQDIYEALDSSEFLIVICTPDTPKSLWVQREIQHFISVHGRSRVLTVLAAGTVEQSVPECITTVYGEDGAVVDRVEPLCAYLVDENRDQVLENLKSEFLRLVAAILGCPYDSVVQRHKRYRMRQLTAAVSAAAAVVAVIMGLLVWWNLDVTAKNEEITAKNEEISGLNTQIRQQLLQTQLNESKALTLLSQSQLEKGDRFGAVQNALSALEGDRPYYAPAELAMEESLYLYREKEYRPVLSMEEPGDSHAIGVSPCGRYLVMDNSNYMILLDMDTGLECWRVPSPSNWLDRTLYIDPELEYLLLLDPYDGHICSFETGEVLYTLSQYYQNIVPLAASKDAGKVVLDLWKEEKTVVFDVKEARELYGDLPGSLTAEPVFSNDGRFLSLTPSGEEQNLLVLDLQENNLREENIAGGIWNQIGLPCGDVLLLSDPVAGRYSLYRMKWGENSPEWMGEISFADSTEQLLASDRYLYCIDTDQIQAFSLTDCAPLETLQMAGQHLGKHCGDTAYLDEQQVLMVTRTNGLYRASPETGSFDPVYTTPMEIARVQYSEGIFSIIYSENANITFLRICGDDNAAAAEKREQPAYVYAEFDHGLLTLKTHGSEDIRTIQCPYAQVQETPVHRTMEERFELTYSIGMAEMYFDRNGLYVICYYEGGYQDLGLDVFVTPQAYAIYSEQDDKWNWFEDASLSDSSMGVFFMNEDPGFAIACGTNTLKVYDFESNAITLEMQVPLLYLSGIRFSEDDRYLLAFDTTRNKSVLIDIAEGKILGAISYIPRIYGDIHLTVTEDRIYMAEMTSDGDQYEGLILHRETLETVARIPDLDDYDRDSNRIVLDSGVSFPAYATRDIIAMAKALLTGRG